LPLVKDCLIYASQAMANIVLRDRATSDGRYTSRARV
jgi:hypothetical protein